MNALVSVIKHAVMITAFVSVMMLVIEYVNVLTQGQWQARLSHRALGAIRSGSLSRCNAGLSWRIRGGRHVLPS